MYSARDESSEPTAAGERRRALAGENGGVASLDRKDRTAIFRQRCEALLDSSRHGRLVGVAEPPA
jgi:hypothetical protein